jgi:hypothetical protein
MRNWKDVLPKHIASQQHIYERSLQAKKMRDIGFTYEEIGKRIGKTRERARQDHVRWLRKFEGKKSPVERYFLFTFEDMTKLCG